ncbi:hypothetical protein KUTeg_007529 [Tegillarca granosa]|uniref:glutamyl aminopeptidase n=1 Tax=Tegillarca granosa TaxID=220873 RepID=A0ABQ9FDJ3_TEGGR|nr:hypothetical protein KUTeg_007529 [Tegillarca granosa]
MLQVNITPTSYSRAEYLQTTNFSLDIGVRLLDEFEDYFGIRYPMPKLDSIALPDFAAAAMENWGLITYRESVMLYDPGANTKFQRSFTAIVVSHELAHMWFGNLVSPSWWDDLWLNEGFATFLEHFGLDLVEKDWKMMDLINIDVVQYILPIDSLMSSHPLYLNVSQPSEIEELFDDITYYKLVDIIYVKH